mmetsp:Transcript_108160/g.161802  ORF Transcript_108160/g.161802 Transcript_108160/m.161802 type:complete len:171 (-) Transcript_108160:140-652(-)
MISVAILATLLASSSVGIEGSNPERIYLHSMKSGIIETSLNIAQSLLLPNALIQAKSNLSSPDGLWGETEQKESTWIVQHEMRSEIPLGGCAEHASPNTTSQHERIGSASPLSSRGIDGLILPTPEAYEAVQYQGYNEFSGMECSAQTGRCSSRSRIPTNSGTNAAARRW